MVVIKKGCEDAEVTYEDAGLVFHVRLADAGQDVLKKLKELGVEAVEEKKAAKE